MKRFLIISIVLIINGLGCKPSQPTPSLESPLASANTSIAPWQRVPERLTFENLTVDNGLSSNSITRLFMDKKGYLWVGTDNGLNRYDGFRFKIYRHDRADSNSILDNNIIDIQADSKGHLWVFTPKGLNEILPSGKINAFLNDTSFTKHVSTNRFKMFLDSHDRIWFNGWTGKLPFYFDIVTQKRITHSNKNFSSFHAKEDALKNVWALRHINDTLLDWCQWNPKSDIIRSKGSL